MKVINVHGISLQFDADQVTQGKARIQAEDAVDMINELLQREPHGLGAQLICYWNEETQVSTDDVDKD